LLAKQQKKALIEQSANMANINENTKRIAHMQTAEYVLANMQSACSLNLILSFMIILLIILK
jgi:hypothetical protein